MFTPVSSHQSELVRAAKHRRPLRPYFPINLSVMHIQVMLMNGAAMVMCDEWHFHAALDLGCGHVISCCLSRSVLKAWHWSPPSAPRQGDKLHIEPFNFPPLPLNTIHSIEKECRREEERADMWDQSRKHYRKTLPLPSNWHVLTLTSVTKGADLRFDLFSTMHNYAYLCHTDPGTSFTMHENEFHIMRCYNDEWKSQHVPHERLNIPTATRRLTQPYRTLCLSCNIWHRG